MEKERQQRIAAGIPNETRGRIAGQRGFIDLTNQASMFPEFLPAQSTNDIKNPQNATPDIATTTTPDVTMSTHVPSIVNDPQEEQITPPEWEIYSSNVPQN